ncbi:ABC transporter ATP-binding protein [Azospirillum picis]|uniref:Spermidine/putrescine transport system ATP-binding protein n=1 Tax=Azospirillum picis TaxID=488438 RepID=A0ABU0MVP2_9PROT|nr:ABC transporter ATP-binding protein [Azospirillum picis]MBP2301906.1 spermidine/putrescine transport system ATP-binding protein [Azospirillum picis]MDQ0537258.1 spermidine/putrescine transport system ATP-binding protein [Azospirillum picis]
MSQDVQLDSVTMRFGDTVAVREVSLTIRAGEFFSFLGPSGCGKTTILRMISGFMEPTSGAVRIGGRDMRGIGPNRRPTALIFQNLALFPLMTVAENIGFGLEVRGVPAGDRKRRVAELLELVALPGTADKRVTDLSGGQRQRIAIARALAVEPAVLLLDEPLSALDLKLRQHMRAELRELQKRTGVTFIYITHDQGEALTMSDRIGVMSRGVLEQVGDGQAIYDHPETAFVASFVGESNRFAGPVVEAADGWAVLDTGFGRLRGRNPRRLAPGDHATLFVRPERLSLGWSENTLNNVLDARVSHRDFEGAFVNAFLDGGLTVQVPHLGQEPAFVPGETVRLGFRAEDAVALPGA